MRRQITCGFRDPGVRGRGGELHIKETLGSLRSYFREVDYPRAHPGQTEVELELLRGRIDRRRARAVEMNRKRKKAEVP